MSEMLCKCSGKYIDIYFILKITYLRYFNIQNCDYTVENSFITVFMGIRISH